MADSAQTSDLNKTKLGVFYGVMAYTCWGIIPPYFKLVREAGAWEITAHRAIWSFLMLLGIMAFRREIGGFATIFKNPKLFRNLACSTLLIVGNWTIFVYAIITDQIKFASLGYFINPLVSVLLGWIFLRERLRPLQWVSVGLAFTGIAIKTVDLGALPWLSLGLASCFGLYGLVRKQTDVSAAQGLSFETLLMWVVAVPFLFMIESNGNGTFVAGDWVFKCLMIFGGVITITPLLFFAGAARRLPLATVGFLQYIAPTLQLVLAILVFKESFEVADQISFGIIWIALAIYSFDSWKDYRSKSK